MRAYVYLAVFGLILVCLGAAVGIVGYRHFDPLRQRPATIDRWFTANVQGDAKTLWDLTSKDEQNHEYSGSYQDFVAENTHAPSTNAPKITFIASIPLAGADKEVFYDLQYKNKLHSTIAVYVTDSGQFDGFAE